MKKLFATCLLALLFVREGSAQTDTANRPSILIVPKLQQPTNTKVTEKDFGAYLLVYFKDQDQSAYFAVSPDGYTFTDLNNGQAIFIGSKLAEQKGVRDPHITRGPDGAFYLAMTDLHIFGQRAGFRDNGLNRNMAGEITEHLY